MEQTLYRFFDSENRLLYVGITNLWYQRFHQHEKDSGWFASAASCTFTKYPDRESVIAAELEAIQTESPLFNKANNPKHESAVDHFQKFKPCIFDDYEFDDFHQPVFKWIRYQVDNDWTWPRKNTKWAAFIWFGAYNAAAKRDGFYCRNCEAIFTTSMYRGLALEAKKEYFNAID